MAPRAIRKAECLARFVTHSGAPQSEFVVSVTQEEAFELLDYLLECERTGDDSVLRSDIATAIKHGNPWPVLENFNLLGFPITRAEWLH